MRFQVVSSRLYFVGGVFGVGKSTLCKALSRFLSARHLRASDLIRFMPNPRDVIGKATQEVVKNQEVLLAALDRQRAAGGMVFLDGHFCLLDDAYSIVPLPVRIFERINPAAMVLVEATVADIVNRLVQRDGRHIEADLVQLLL